MNLESNSVTLSKAECSTQPAIVVPYSANCSHSFQVLTLVLIEEMAQQLHFIFLFICCWYLASTYLLSVVGDCSV